MRMCMYVHVFSACMCMYLPVSVHIAYALLHIPVILHVFFASKVASRTICTSYIQYMHIHTHTYKNTGLIHTHTYNNTCKYVHFKQGRKKCIWGLLEDVFACMCIYVYVLISPEFNAYCVYCMYVHTCVYMWMYVFIHIHAHFSISMCNVLHVLYVWACMWYVLYALAQASTDSVTTGPKHLPAWREPADPTQGTHGQQPLHFNPQSGTHALTRFGALVRAARVGGGLSSPTALPMGPPRTNGTQRARPGPRPIGFGK
jgi:hypothetical protein